MVHLSRVTGATIKYEALEIGTMEIVPQLALLIAVIGSLALSLYCVIHRNLQGAIAGLVIAVIAGVVLYTQSDASFQPSTHWLSLLIVLCIGVIGIVLGAAYSGSPSL